MIPEYFRSAATWEGAGTLTDPHGNRQPFRTVTTVEIPSANRRTLRASLWFEGATAPAFEAAYDLELDEYGRTAAYEQNNAMLGKIRGRIAFGQTGFVIAYGTADGSFTGYEAMTQIAPDEYRALSLLQQGNQLVTLMEATVRRRVDA